METIVSIYKSCLHSIRKLFRRPHPNRFRILSKHDPFILTTYLFLVLFPLCFYLIYSDTLKKSEILVILFSLFIFLIKFITYIILFPFVTIDKQPFQITQNSFYSVSLHIYTEYIVCKNMQIMFEKLYRTHSGSVQFVEHDPHIFALFLT